MNALMFVSSRAKHFEVASKTCSPASPRFQAGSLRERTPNREALGAQVASKSARLMVAADIRGVRSRVLGSGFRV